MRRLKRWLLPESPDVLGVLRRQAHVTLAGMDAFASWSSGGDAQDGAFVRKAEHEADDVRRELLELLSKALTTPVDQEDLYWLSERLDAVINTAKNTVREADALGVAPDEHTAAMGALALDAARHLAAGFEHLAEKGAHPGAEADAAVKSARGIERSYRDALVALPPDVDVKTAISTREIYHGYTEIADAVVRVATRIWYAVLKIQ